MKKLAILLASLSLCACSIVGCSDDKNDDGDEQNIEKAAEGEKCGTSADGKECQDNTLECAKKGGEGDDKDDFICQKIESVVEKAAKGQPCGSSAEGKECEGEDLKCEAKADDANAFICKVQSGKACVDNDICEGELVCKDNDGSDGKSCQAAGSGGNGGNDEDPLKGIAACERKLECNVAGITDAICHPESTDEPGGETQEPTEECKNSMKAYNECVIAAQCEELVADQLAVASCKDSYVAYMVACSGMKDKDGECDPLDASKMCVPVALFCQTQADESKKCVEPIADGAACLAASDQCASKGFSCIEDASSAEDPKPLVCALPGVGAMCQVAVGCAGGAEGDLVCTPMSEATPSYGMCKIKDGHACSGTNDMNCASGGYGKCVEDTENAGSYICADAE